MSGDHVPKGETPRSIHWPHLVDRAGAVGARYEVQPLAYAVHSEYVNRPTVAIIDREGVLRFLYRGTYWGDRPEVSDILTMLRTGNYDFESPKRLRAETR